MNFINPLGIKVLFLETLFDLIFLDRRIGIETLLLEKRDFSSQF